MQSRTRTLLLVACIRARGCPLSRKEKGLPYGNRWHFLEREESKPNKPFTFSKRNPKIDPIFVSTQQVFNFHLKRDSIDLRTIVAKNRQFKHTPARAHTHVAAYTQIYVRSNQNIQKKILKPEYPLTDLNISHYEQTRLFHENTHTHSPLIFARACTQTTANERWYNEIQMEWQTLPLTHHPDLVIQKKG